MSVSEMESYRDLILENIEYDHLCREFTTYREDLDEIVELMVETVCAKRKTTRIAGSDFPHEVVRSRFLKLDSSHIEFVMECLRNNTTEIRNMKQYLLAVLFNAPTTMVLTGSGRSGTKKPSKPPPSGSCMSNTSPSCWRLLPRTSDTGTPAVTVTTRTP